jgi:diguanylate cyclase (GGDEF)-like protein
VLLRRALHDPLTGLPNRAMLDLRFEEGGVGAVLMLDLDHFKDVNDTYGHDAGDLVLREVATRLLASCRPEDLVVRVGGDEFVVVIGGVVTDDALESTAQRLRHALAEPIVLPDAVVSVGASVGAVPSALGDAPEHLLAEADRRMYQGKRSRRRTDPHTS